MKLNPVILVFTSHYLPGYLGGGPIRTIANMVERLGDEFEFRIVTADRDLGDGRPYRDVEVDSWSVVGKAKVYYCGPSSRSFAVYARLMRETPHDVLYLNSFFDPKSTLRPLILRRLGLVPDVPLVLAPKGEFSPGALSIKSWKKMPFIALARLARLYCDALWHASTEFERNDIVRALASSGRRVSVARNVAVAPDILDSARGASILNFDNDLQCENRALRVCFLSRIVPKKNLDFALKVLSCVTVPVSFNIFGPKEDSNYWRECQRLIEVLPPHVNVNYCGSVEHAEVRGVIGAHDIFFVPSRGENFGHVFMEALSAGVPILVSDLTPWRGLESLGVGWDISLERQDRFAQAIDDFSNLGGAARRQMRLGCLEFARKYLDDAESVDLNRAVFAQALTTARW